MTKKFAASGHQFPSKFGFRQSAGEVGVKSHLRAAPKRSPAPAAMPAGPSGGYPPVPTVHGVLSGLNKPGAAAAGAAPSADIPRSQRGAPRAMAGFAKGGKVGCKS